MTTLTAEERFTRHVRDSKKPRSFYLHNAIRKHGAEAFKVTTLTESNDKESLKELERLFIAFFQTLTPRGYNLTVGGDGIIGYAHTQKDRLAISLAQKKRYSDPIQLEKLREQGRKALSDPEVCKRARLKSAEAMRTPEFRARAAERAKLFSSDPRIKALRIAATKRMWANPIRRAALIEKLNSIKQTPEFRKKAADTAKRKWGEPATREKNILGLRTKSNRDEWRRKLSEAHKGKKHGPASESRKEKIRAAQLVSWANPETHARRALAIAPTREKAIADPAIRQKISDSVKRLWSNPDYRSKALIGLEKARAAKQLA